MEHLLSTEISNQCSLNKPSCRHPHTHRPSQICCLIVRRSKVYKVALLRLHSSWLPQGPMSWHCLSSALPATVKTEFVVSGAIKLGHGCKSTGLKPFKNNFPVKLAFLALYTFGFFQVGLSNCKGTFPDTFRKV